MVGSGRAVRNATGATLSLKIGLAIILVEVVVLTIVGAVYLSRFGSNLDAAEVERAELPGELIRAGYLSVAVIGDPETMQTLTSERMITAWAVDESGRIVAASDASLRGRVFQTVTDLDPSFFSFATARPAIVPRRESTIAITPIPRTDGEEPRLLLYVEVSTEDHLAQEAQLLRAILFGSIGAVLATSFVIFLAFRRVVVARLTETLSVLAQAGSGDYSARVDGDLPRDEIGILQQRVNDTIGEIDVLVQDLRSALTEKTVLLQELYHRTKNNMQTIISILSMQGDKLDDEMALQVIRDTQNRIRSMALVHEQLYRSQDLSSIDLAEYVQEFVRQSADTYPSGASRPAISSRLAEGVRVSIDVAIPSALVLNELVTNAVKHGGSAAAPSIFVELSELTDGRIRVAVVDNGSGIPEDFSIEASGGMGLRTVALLAKHQLRGTFSITNENGVRAEVVFPNPDIPSRV